MFNYVKLPENKPTWVLYTAVYDNKNIKCKVLTVSEELKVDAQPSVMHTVVT
jgi:hypothetical protein